MHPFSDTTTKAPPPCRRRSRAGGQLRDATRGADSSGTCATHKRNRARPLRRGARPELRLEGGAGHAGGEGLTATLIDMTSQRWLTEQEVERPLWTHWITVVRPAGVSSDIGLLFITGGSLGSPAAGGADRLARRHGARHRHGDAELRLVPNQPVVFKDDPEHKPRTEDDFIAYTWNHFIQTGDDRWPARLPMTKSAVRAMDAVTAFTASPAGGGRPWRASSSRAPRSAAGRPGRPRRSIAG